MPEISNKEKLTKLFIVAIGGTGSRVLKAFTMLLASGVKSQNNYEIVPVIIDPHSSNKDLIRTEQLLLNYEKIHKKVSACNSLFQTKITNLATIAEVAGMAADTYKFELTDMDKPFKEYLNYGSLAYEDKLLSDFLFSGKSLDQRGHEIDLLDLNMDIGFVGNPHVGSVVLNQFKDSEEYKLMTQCFGENDRLFFISSIFGGTGAAGFPIMLKNIRQGNSEANSELLKNSKIGAVTVLPYFNVKQTEDSPIKYSDFVAKTKSALKYYQHNITGTSKRINALYYIGDNHSGSRPIDNDPGHGGQKNEAHLIELLSALSILDFMNAPDSDLITNQGVANNPQYKHFGIKAPVDVVDFSHLDKTTIEHIYQPLLKMYLIDKYLKDELYHSVDSQFWSTNDRYQLNSQFFNNAHSFYHTFKDFSEEYIIWLTEMAHNQRTFKPFNLDGDSNVPIANILKNHIAEIKRPIIKNKPIEYEQFNEALNVAVAKARTTASVEEQFVHVFSEATTELIKQYYQLKI